MKVSFPVAGIIAVLVAIIIAVIALFLREPSVHGSLESIAKDHPMLVAETLLAEENRTSASAMHPTGTVKYDTRAVFFERPYESYVAATQSQDLLAIFSKQDPFAQSDMLQGAIEYFSNGGSLTMSLSGSNPLIPITSALVIAMQDGDYNTYLNSAISPSVNPGAIFIADVQAMDKH